VKGNNTYQIVYAGNSDIAMDGAAGTIYITSSSNGVLQSGAVEAIIENGGVLRRGIQL